MFNSDNIRFLTVAHLHTLTSSLLPPLASVAMEEDWLLRDNSCSSSALQPRCNDIIMTSCWLSVQLTAHLEEGLSLPGVGRERADRERAEREGNDRHASEFHCIQCIHLV